MDRAEPSTTFGRIAALDGVRGIAITLVLLHHANLASSGAGGSVGVSLFFVLSGFLITSLLIEERRATGSVDLGRFYWRRATRLLPAFVVVVFVSALVLVLRGQIPEAIRTTIGAGTFIGNWIMAAGGDWFGPMSHSWSLAIEEQFYLAWPLLLLCLWPLLARFGIPILIALALAAAALRPMLADAGVPAARISFGTDTQADGLLLGCAVAFWRARPTASVRWWVAPIGFGAVLCIAWIAPFGMVFLEGGQAAAVLGAAAIVAAAATHPDRLTLLVLERAPIRYLGRISYSAYLWHYPVMWNANVIDHRPSLATFLTIAVSLGLAGLSYRFVEQPILRWRDSRSRNTATGPARVAPAPDVAQA